MDGVAAFSVSIRFFLAWIAMGLAARALFREFAVELGAGWGLARRKRELQGIEQRLREIEETFSAGMIPEQSRWESLRELPAPWGSLVYESLMALRSSGGAVLPTLKRLRSLSSEQIRALAEARARSSQALSQAGSCLLLIPAFGVTLYELLPGVPESPWVWGGCCSVAFLLACAGALWLVAMAENARWGGLQRTCRSWVLAAQCSGERFLALIRAGSPADLSWVRACELLAREAPALSLVWGASLWKAGGTREGAPGDPAALLLIEAGENMRKAVQLSLVEGRPCVDRVETALAALSHDFRTRVETELALLGTRALKPLFVFIAPAVFLLLAAGLFLCFQSVTGGQW